VGRGRSREKIIISPRIILLLPSFHPEEEREISSELNNHLLSTVGKGFFGRFVAIGLFVTVTILFVARLSMIEWIK